MTTILDARTQYYRDNMFGEDGGASKRWVVFKLGPLPFVIPNSKARMRAVAYHDVHHILTGYQTDWRGEFEISAFEVAGGCRDFWVAWVLNLMGMFVGAFALPRRTFAAFVRGRRSGNLYRVSDLAPVLTRDVEGVRQELGLHDESIEATAADRRAFAGALALGALVYSAAWVVTLAPLALLWWALASGS